MIINERIPSALSGERLDRVVSLITSRSRSAVKPLIKDGHVTVNGEVPVERVTRVTEGDVVRIDLPETVVDEAPQPSAAIEISLIHEDEHFVVVDKPAGLVVHPGAGHTDDTLVNGLLARFPELAEVGQSARPGVVHRLDRDTTGLLVVARTQPAYDALVADMAARTITREYEAVTLGHTESQRGVVDAPIGRSRRSRVRMAVSNDGRPARTHYERRAQYYDPIGATWFACTLETGRTHQIRVHMAAIGTPVLGDYLYGRPDALNVSRQQLHAARLAFDHPIDRHRLEFASPMPDDIVSTLQTLGEPDPNGVLGF